MKGLSAREAGFRGLRSEGWTLIGPIATFLGLVVGLTTNVRAGVIAGGAVSLFGVAILTLGYMLGDIFGHYWMVAQAVAAAPITALAWALNITTWQWTLAGTGVVIVLTGITVGIARTSSTENGLWELVKTTIRGFAPGHR